jgi:hypothetical protein
VTASASGGNYGGSGGSNGLPHQPFTDTGQYYPLPINPVAVRDEIERMLENPACAMLLQYLINKVTEDRQQANLPGHLIEGGDVLKIFDRINRPFYGGRGMVRAGQPGSKPPHMTQANGRFADRTAQIQLGAPYLMVPPSDGYTCPPEFAHIEHLLGSKVVLEYFQRRRRERTLAPEVF